MIAYSVVKEQILSQMWVGPTCTSRFTKQRFKQKLLPSNY